MEIAGTGSHAAYLLVCPQMVLGADDPHDLQKWFKKLYVLFQ